MTENRARAIDELPRRTWGYMSIGRGVGSDWVGGE